MTDIFDPILSLKKGYWFKFICGASLQDLPAVRSLTLAYTLAGADCIDVAADPAVIEAAKEAISVAKNLAVDAQKRGFGYRKSPLLMVSLNDGEDPHFRKAEFNPTQCPANCPRPCEQICPAQAIVFNRGKEDSDGIIPQKCYGCGRCLPVCPYDLIYTSSYVSTPGAIAPLVISSGVDTIEIHTQVGRLVEFKRLWQAILPHIEHLQLVAISCADGKGLVDYLRSLSDLIFPLPCTLIWQVDGRPMSGDIGDGTTLTTIKLAQKVLTARLPGYVQLAGGTNSYTVPKLKAMGLLKGQKDIETRRHRDILPQSPSPYPISGVAYGSYARVLLSPVLQKLEALEVEQDKTIGLENQPVLLWQAVELADSLVSQIKSQPELKTLP